MTVIISLIALSVSLESELPAPGEMIDQCLAANSGWEDDARQCINQYSERCMETREDGYTTVGMMMCSQEELAVWDERLNAAYGRLRDNLEPRIFQEVQEAQRAWLDFRDAECEVGPAFVEGGTMAPLLYGGCMQQMTAERMIRLMQMEKEGGY